MSDVVHLWREEANHVPLAEDDRCVERDAGFESGWFVRRSLVYGFKDATNSAIDERFLEQQTIKMLKKIFEIRFYFVRDRSLLNIVDERCLLKLSQRARKECPTETSPKHTQTDFLLM